MSHRRYKIGKHPGYDHRFDLRKGKSGIINHRFATGNLALAFWSESGIRELLDQWQGTEDGLYPDGSRYWAVSHLKNAQDALAAVDQEWEAMVVKAQRAGRQPPTEPPEELVQAKLVAEADLDVCMEEVDFLRKRLAEYAARKQKEDDHLILAYGPAGTTWGSDPPREVDHQPVKWDEKLGHFVIDCKKSPYHGVTLPNYYAYVCKPWREAKNAAYQEAHKKATDLFLSEGERLRAGEEAARILRDPHFPPWPPKPED